MKQRIHFIVFFSVMTIMISVGFLFCKQSNHAKNQQNKDKQEKQDKQQNQQMSKENAEQLLNAAMQEEKQTQQRLKKAMSQPRRKNLQKNW